MWAKNAVWLRREAAGVFSSENHVYVELTWPPWIITTALISSSFPNQSLSHLRNYFMRNVLICWIYDPFTKNDKIALDKNFWLLHDQSGFIICDNIWFFYVFVIRIYWVFNTFMCLVFRKVAIRIVFVWYSGFLNADEYCFNTRLMIK